MPLLELAASVDAWVDEGKSAAEGAVGVLVAIVDAVDQARPGTPVAVRINRIPLSEDVDPHAVDKRVIDAYEAPEQRLGTRGQERDFGPVELFEPILVDFLSTAAACRRWRGGPQLLLYGKGSLESEANGQL